MLQRTLGLATIAALAMLASAATAQTKLNWAHVYEVTEPFHTESVWAAEEIGKRTDGPLRGRGLPRLAARQGGRHQPGPEARHRRHHHLRLELRRPRVCAHRHHLLPLHLPRPGPPHRLHQERRLPAARRRLRGGLRATTSPRSPTTAPATPRRTRRSSCSDLDGVKMRVPDVPAYLAMPQSCGANTAPIAFAEVYLALQNGTVDAQENPLTTIEAKKFYEVQTNIALTGHIVDHLNTVVSQSRWASLSDEDKAIFTEVMQEAAARATDDHQGARGRAGAELQGQGHQRHRGRQGDLRGRRAREQAGRRASATTRPTGRRSRRSSPGLLDAPTRGAARAPPFRQGGARMAGEQEHHTPITAEEIAHVFEEEEAPVDLSALLGRGLGDARGLLGHGALRLPAVLHPLRAQQQPRLDRGDRHQLPGRRGLPRLGLVRPPLAPHPGRRALPLPAARGRPASLSTFVDLVRIVFFAYASLAALALRRPSSPTSAW